MFNVNRIETISKNIQTSTLLSDSEKSDWLSLLELMNDKQLGELEEILTAEPVATTPPQPTPAPAPRPVSAPKAYPVQTMPPLSHIANIPTDVNMERTVVKQPRQPAPELKPLSVRATPSPSLTAIAPKTPAVPTPVPAPAPTPAKPSAPVAQSEAVYSIQQPEQLQQISVQTIRSFSYQSIFDVVRKVIQEQGYFTVLQMIESSPLYASYLSAGTQWLGQSVEGNQSDLTQAEFEFMTDLLRNMRFNRW